MRFILKGYGSGHAPLKEDSQTAKQYRTLRGSLSTEATVTTSWDKAFLPPTAALLFKGVTRKTGDSQDVNIALELCDVSAAEALSVASDFVKLAEKSHGWKCDRKSSDEKTAQALVKLRRAINAFESAL